FNVAEIRVSVVFRSICALRGFGFLGVATNVKAKTKGHAWRLSTYSLAIWRRLDRGDERENGLFKRGLRRQSALSLGEKEQRDWCAGAANVIRITPRRHSLLRSEERAQQVRCPMQSRLTESLHAAARSPSPQGRRPI